MSAIVGKKLIAVVLVLGWWNQRQSLKTQEMRFSLVVSVFGPGVYTAIRSSFHGVVSGPARLRRRTLGIQAPEKRPEEREAHPI